MNTPNGTEERRTDLKEDSLRDRQERFAALLRIEFPDQEFDSHTLEHFAQLQQAWEATRAPSPEKDEEKKWEKTKREVITLLEKTIGEQQWDFFDDPTSLERLKEKFDCHNSNRSYWLEETFYMYQKIAIHRHLPSADRKILYYKKTAKENQRLHHVVESQQFEAEEIEQYCDLALLLKKYDEFCTNIADMERNEHDLPPEVIAAQRDIRSRMGSLLEGRIITNLFIQPSSRTHRSFEAAEKMLGAEVINEKDPNMSSMAKGETGPDTIRTFAQYCHAIVQRAPSNYATEEAIFAQEIFPHDIPILNAGSGTRQHPTQALLDLATIKESLGLSKLSELNGKTVTIVGDLLYGRTVRSLIYSLAKVAPDVRLRLVSPEQLRLKPLFRKHLQDRGVQFEEMTDLEAAMKGSDVVYVTRIQQEWFKENNQMDLYYQIKDNYLVTEDHISLLDKKAAIIDTPDEGEDDQEEQRVAILHPLPRVNELSWRTDKYPQSRIWQEVKTGKYMRGGLLLTIFGKKKEFEKITGDYDIEQLPIAA